MKKILLWFLVMLVGISMLATFSLVGCKTTTATTTAAETTAAAETTVAAETTAKEPVTLTLMANQDWVTKPYMKKAWENYEKATGNKLDLQVVPIDSGEQIMKTKFATGDIPDIFMHFGGYGLAPYDPEKNFVDFSDAKWVDDIKPYVKDQTISNGKVYGLPLWEASISGMLYNKEIFAKLGITVPTTQTEFEAACETIKNAGITPIYMAFKDVWPLLYQFAVDTMVVNIDTLDKLNSNQIKYADIPEFTDMIKWYKKMADNGYLGAKFTTNTWDGAPQALGEGKYAMMYVWDTWVSSDLETKYPGISDKFGLCPAFLGTPGQGTYEGPNVCLTFVNKNSKNVDAATEFVNFLAKTENINIAFEGFATAPVFTSETSNIPTKQFTEAEESINKVGNSSIAWPRIIGFTQVEAAKYIQDLMIGNKTVEQCIEAMDQDRIDNAKAQQVPGF